MNIDRMVDGPFEIEVHCPQGFSDFSIIKERIPVGGTVWVTARLAKLMKQSDPEVEFTSTRAPNPQKAVKDEA